MVWQQVSDSFWSKRITCLLFPFSQLLLSPSWIIFFNSWDFLHKFTCQSLCNPGFCLFQWSTVKSMHSHSFLVSFQICDSKQTKSVSLGGWYSPCNISVHPHLMDHSEDQQQRLQFNRWWLQIPEVGKGVLKILYKIWIFLCIVFDGSVIYCSGTFASSL